jgi:DNA-binding transcriptional LysR family regulator
VLTVPDMYYKIALQRAGLGVGYLPLHMTRDDVAAGRLVIKQVVEPKASAPMFLAWRTNHKGKALEWWVMRLEDKEVQRALLS